jgi:hypothetical protein
MPLEFNSLKFISFRARRAAAGIPAQSICACADSPVGGRDPEMPDAA